MSDRSMKRCPRICLRPGVFTRPKGVLLVDPNPDHETPIQEDPDNQTIVAQRATLNGMACWLATIQDPAGEVQRQHVIPLTQVPQGAKRYMQ